jgi:hypothetical protein
MIDVSIPVPGTAVVDPGAGIAATVAGHTRVITAASAIIFVSNFAFPILPL